MTGAAANPLIRRQSVTGTQLAMTSFERARACAASIGRRQVMGIFGALTTAVTGLRAQSFALENISGNIANSQTTAFKREDTSFVDLIPDNPPSKQLSGTVAAYARATNTA